MLFYVHSDVDYVMLCPADVMIDISYFSISIDLLNV